MPLQVLEGYMLQGISGNALADKVLDCFKDAIHDHSVRVVRSMLITQPGLMDAIANSGGDSSFADMCRCAACWCGVHGTIRAARACTVLAECWGVVTIECGDVQRKAERRFAVQPQGLGLTV
jgi:hypothetical protein